MKIAPRLLGISMLGMVACKSSPTDKTIARELCSCLEPMIEMYHKMEDQTANADENAMIEAMEELERLATQSQDCTDRITEKYGDLAERQAGLEDAMQKACPDIMRTLREFGGSE